MKKIQIIGLGNAGVRVVAKYKRLHPQMECVAINSDKQNLDESGIEKIVLLDKQNGYCCGSSQDAIDYVKACKNEILNFIDKESHIILVAGIAGNCGSGCVIEITKMLNELECKTSTVFSMPMGFEGELRKDNAINTLNYLLASNSDIEIVKNSDIVVVEKVTTLKNAFNQLDDLFIAAIEKVSECKV